MSEAKADLRVPEGSGEAPAKATPLRLLLVEGAGQDESAIFRELWRAGHRPTLVRVETRDAFIAALDGASWDVVIADHAHPGYGGLSALADLQISGKDIPFILVSASLGDDIAVNAMRAGARDHVGRADLTRLPAVVEREVRERAVRFERDRMRERLVVSERMASAGTMAAGVAHEINNPLAVAVVNLEMVADSLRRSLVRGADLRSGGSQGAAALLPPLEALEEPLADAREALERIREIVRDVKLFSRPDDAVVGPVDLHRVIDSSTRMTWNEIRHRARLVKDYAPLPMVQANEARLGQVVLNLLVNAAQAIPEGHAEENEIRVSTRTDHQGRVILELADTGGGIHEEALDQIFEPFFTTKPAGLGIGLGLSICRRIVSELGGRIEVESHVGRGSLFRVVLPAARESVGPVKAAEPRPSGVRARVMVVDDEVLLGRALGRGLSPHHDVTIVSKGREAVARIEGGERFDVVFLDVMIPDMSGVNVYRRLQQISEEQAARVVFLTGGTFSGEAGEFLDGVSNLRLDKPVKTAKLLEIISSFDTR
jgi:signal transduction histidine kinase